MVAIVEQIDDFSSLQRKTPVLLPVKSLASKWGIRLLRRQSRLGYKWATGPPAQHRLVPPIGDYDTEDLQVAYPQIKLSITASLSDCGLLVLEPTLVRTQPSAYEQTTVRKQNAGPASFSKQASVCDKERLYPVMTLCRCDRLLADANALFRSLVAYDLDSTIQILIHHLGRLVGSEAAKVILRGLTQAFSGQDEMTLPYKSEVKDSQLVPWSLCKSMCLRLITARVNLPELTTSKASIFKRFKLLGRALELSAVKAEWDVHINVLIGISLSLKLLSALDTDEVPSEGACEFPSDESNMLDNERATTCSETNLNSGFPDDSLSNFWWSFSDLIDCISSGGLANVNDDLLPLTIVCFARYEHDAVALEKAQRKILSGYMDIATASLKHEGVSRQTSLRTNIIKDVIVYWDSLVGIPTEASMMFAFKYGITQIARCRSPQNIKHLKEPAIMNSICDVLVQACGCVAEDLITPACLLQSVEGLVNLLLSSAGGGQSCASPEEQNIISSIMDKTMKLYEFLVYSLMDKPPETPDLLLLHILRYCRAANFTDGSRWAHGLMRTTNPEIRNELVLWWYPPMEPVSQVFENTATTSSGRNGTEMLVCLVVSSVMSVLVFFLALEAIRTSRKNSGQHDGTMTVPGWLF